MKATGVVRRIDDLGRIVIPKEIRKTLRIKDGESVEIFLNDDNIILKKYLPLGELPGFYKDYVDSIYSEINKNIMVVDRDHIVAVAGSDTLKKKYVDSVISMDLDDIIQNREVVYSKNIEIISMTMDFEERVSYVVAPIISSGDAIGAIVIFSVDESIDDFTIKIGSIAAKFLGKYVE